MRTKTVRRDASTYLSTEYTFDSFNRLSSVKSPKNELTQMTYLPSGELYQVIDPNSKAMTFEYNNLGQVIKKTDPLNRITQLQYDGNGNVIWEQSPMGHEFFFTYDNNDKLIKKVAPDNIYDFVYDVRGNMISAQSNTSLVTFDVDVKGRIRSTTSSGRNALSSYPSVTVNYTYNANDQRTTMTDSLGGSNTYSYYADGKLQSVLNHKGELYSFDYDSRHRLTDISRPGINTYLSYSDKNLVTSITHQAGNEVRAFFNYTRNDQGFITSSATEDGVSNFGYDSNSYLISATQPAARLPASESGFANETFAYDNIGNRTSDQEGSYTFDTSRQELVQGPRFTYRYDNNGNMVGKVSRSTGEYTKFEYSSENQLVAVYFYPSELSSSATKEAHYAYDVLGRRVRKVVVDHENLSEPLKTFTRQYAYDGQEMHIEFNGQGALLARYTHSNLRTDDVLAVDVTAAGVAQKVAVSNGTYAFLKDQLGTIQSIADAGGSVIQKYSYSVFGTILAVRSSDGQDISSAPLLNTHFSFTGREFDSESGLFHYRARMLDASTGRFLQRDPHPGKLDLPISTTNAYAYAHNNPSTLVDPNGKLPFLIGLGIAALVAGATSAILQASITGKWDRGSLTKSFTDAAVFTLAVGLAGYTAGYIATSLGASVVAAQVWASISGAAIGAFLGAVQAAPGYELVGGVVGALGGLFGGLLSAAPGINAAPWKELGTGYWESLFSSAPAVVRQLNIFPAGIGLSLPTDPGTVDHVTPTF